jgi:hypothetical protein
MFYSGLEDEPSSVSGATRRFWTKSGPLAGGVTTSFALLVLQSARKSRGVYPTDCLNGPADVTH